MSFRFEPAATAAAWTRERYKAFIDTAPAYPNVEEASQKGYRVVESRRGGMPKVKDVVEQIVAVRAFTEDGLRSFLLAPDTLVVNYLKGDKEAYPGFSTLLDEAIGHCRRYEECYQPAGVLEAALHYVDLVEIPIPENRLLASEEYFTLNVEAPETTFGPFGAFELKAFFKPPSSPTHLEVIFAAPPSRKEDTHRPFRLEWHTTVPTGTRMNLDAVRANLQGAHDRLEKCFRQAFTPKGWALFEPDDQP